MPELSKPANPLPKYQAEAAAKPNDAEVQTSLGWAYYGQKQFADAIQAFEAALRLGGDNLDASSGLGMSHKMAGSPGLAIKSFEMAAALAEQIDNHDRKKMLSRLVSGQLNELQTGDWNLTA
ncbi:MAG TPA: tetratricopeptide repeat protein [Anaerolineales bacterium]|nr:tetratricopeptide repeat protein [Anaerolineales bacterium]